MKPIHDHIRVKLIGRDGNALAILAAFQSALRKGGVDGEEIDRILQEATSDDYDHLLVTVMDHVHVY